MLGITALSDQVLAPAIAVNIVQTASRPEHFDVLLYAIGGATVLLSVQPVLNLFSRNQLMNSSFNPLHLVNTYGAFGSVTKVRYEIVIEGTTDSVITESTQWQEYGFKGKPGDPRRRPSQVAPYHLRLDWLMWFLPFSVAVTGSGIYSGGYDRWFLRFIIKLLEGDDKTLKLMGHNPFPEAPPNLVRALFYSYRYTNRRERNQTGAWWVRRLVAVYLPPVSLKAFAPTL